MKLFDAHNHVQDARLAGDLPLVMRRAAIAGVARMAVKGCCEADWPRVIEIADQYEGCERAFGIHPWFVDSCSVEWLEQLRALLKQYPRSTVGEIGIDHAVKERNDDAQESVFMAQMRLACELGRPVSIHCRQAWGRLIELLDQLELRPPRMLIHCFGGSAEVAKELVKRGGYISFSGSITRPNNKKAGPAIRAVPADRLLIETDAPDILPQTVEEKECLTAEGQRLNEPAFLRKVLTAAAFLRGCSEQELANLTSQNAERFFQGHTD